MTVRKISTVIVITDHGYVNGGVAQVAIGSAKALRRLGVHVIFVAAVGPLDPSLRQSGVECVDLNQFDLLGDPIRVRAMFKGLWNHAVAERLRNLLVKYVQMNAVIHVHGWAKALSPSIGSVIADCKIPVVMTLHEYFISCPNGGFFDYRRKEICTRIPLSKDCLTTNCDPRSFSQKWWRVLRQLILHSVANLPFTLKDVILISNTQDSVLSRYLPAHIKRHRVRNPVEVVTPVDRVGAENNALYLFVGRFSPEKGPLSFAQVAKVLRLQAVFIGAGELQKEIESCCPDADLPGWIDAETLRAYLRKARVLVVPSEWYETFGLVVVEAMTMGVPVVIGSKNAGTELLPPLEPSPVYEMGNVDDLRNVLRISEDNDIVRLWSERCYAHVKTMDFTLETHARLLLDIYNKMAEEFAA